MSFVSWIDSVPLEGSAAAGRRAQTAGDQVSGQLAGKSLACEGFPEPQSRTIKVAVSAKFAALHHDIDATPDWCVVSLGLFRHFW